MKRLAIFILSLTATILNISAESFTASDGLTYDVVSATEQTCIVGDNSNYRGSSITIPAEARDQFGNTVYKVIGVAGSAFFYGNSQINVTTLDLSQAINLETIGAYAFGNLRQLTGNIDLTACTKLRRIDLAAFYDCELIESIDLSGLANLEVIYSNAFEKCYRLTKVDLSGCAALNQLHMKLFINCTRLTEVDFTGCTALTIIQQEIFSGCTALTKVDLSPCTSLITLAPQAFSGCTKLKEVLLPASLTTTYNDIFEQCTALTSVTCYADTPPKVSNNVVNAAPVLFSAPMTTTGTLYVPRGSVQDYRNHQHWGKAKYIVGLVTPLENVEVTATAIDGTTNPAELKAGESFSLKAKLLPADADCDALKWTASPEDAIEFDFGDNADGVPLEVAATVQPGVTGNVTVTATAYSGDNTVTGSYTFTVSGEVLLGDANDNGSVTLADVITIANEILAQGTGQPSINKRFCFVNADVEPNHIIDIVDQTATTNIAMGLPPFPEGSYTLTAFHQAPNCLSVSDFAPGFNSIAVALPDASDYVALQADFILPDGLEIESMEAATTLDDHIVDYNVAGNKLRVLVYSLSNKPFSSNGESLFVINANVPAVGDITFGDIKAVDTYMRCHMLQGRGGANNGTTAIDTIADDSEPDNVDTPVEIYDLSGRLVRMQATAAELRALKPGLYIVRRGTEARKILVK